MIVTDEFKKYVLKNVPTKVLLREFKSVRIAHYLGWPTDSAFYIDDDCWCDYTVRIVVGKFAFWNPYKRHSCICYFTQDEVKDELDKREHIQRRKNK